MDLKQLVKQLPEQPGIYLMKDSTGTVIYVGKAKSLKARVSQYFHKNSGNSPKTAEMIDHIHSFEYITTDTELEAFLMECSTIKELKPKYNRQLKNYKGYMYIKLSVNEDYPKLSKGTQCIEDGALYFGPFTSEGCVDNAIEFIKDYYPVRKCNRGALTRNSSGCLNFHLGTCLGPCSGNDIRERYGRHIDEIILLLRGKDYTPVKELHSRMKAAAGNQDFERAARYRDQIRGIRHVLNKQRLIRVSQYGRNILALENVDEKSGKLFYIKGNKLLHSELTDTSGHGSATMGEKLRKQAQECFKGVNKCGERRLNQEDIDEAQIIYSYLKSRKNGIRSINIPSSRIDTADYGHIAELLLQK